MLRKDPCKKTACEIQKCLQGKCCIENVMKYVTNSVSTKASNYQESACQLVIQQMLHCCKQWEHLHTVSCSGFSAKSKEDNPISNGII